MNPVKLFVDPGICGMKAHLTVSDQDGRMVVSTDTQCEKVKRLVQLMNGADTFSVAMSPLPKNPVIEKAGEAGLHPCCAMPSALIKAAEVCAGLALRKSVSIEFEE